MKSCEKYLTFNIKELCKKLTDPSQLYSNILRSIHPPFKCPVEAGNYTIKPTDLNLALLALVPIDGYIYMSNFKIVSTDNASKKRKLAWCFNLETKVIKTRLKS